MLVVVGTTTVDLLLIGMDCLPAPGPDEFASGGYALLDDPAHLVLGGNGANTAYVHARLGGLTELVGAVGDDVFGAMAVDWLAASGVGLSALARSDRGATACTVVAVDRSGRRLAFHHAGVSRRTVAEDVPSELLSQASVLLFTSYHLLDELRGEPGAALLARARAGGALTAVDLGPCVEPVADIDELRPLLAMTDVVLANAVELETCTGHAEPTRAARAVLEAGAGSVVAKLGAAGSRRLDAAGETAVSAFPVDVDSTVGAGDAFDAGFLFALGRGDTPAEALRFASAVAAVFLERGRGSLDPPSVEEVERMLERGSP